MPIGTGKCVPPGAASPCSASSWNITGMPRRVCSTTHFWIALTKVTVSRAVRRLPSPRSLPSIGRVIWPMPSLSTVAAFDGSNSPCALTIAFFCCQRAQVCATFSSTVMRPTRSAMRCSMGSDASLYGAGCWAATTPHAAAASARETSAVDRACRRIGMTA